MAVFKRPDAEIHYEVHGSGFPLLLFAPGGLRSQAAYWTHSPSNPSAPPPWMNPMADLSSRFTVIGMDQRNAGASHGVVTSTHGWPTYASDHVALMDRLAPNLEVQKDWRAPTHRAESIRRVTEFLTKHTP